VGALLLKAYLSSVVHWPIGLCGALIEWGFAALFALDMRRRHAASAPKAK